MRSWDHNAFFLVPVSTQVLIASEQKFPILLSSSGVKVKNNSKQSSLFWNVYCLHGWIWCNVADRSTPSLQIPGKNGVHIINGFQHVPHTWWFKPWNNIKRQKLLPHDRFRLLAKQLCPWALAIQTYITNRPRNLYFIVFLHILPPFGTSIQKTQGEI